MRRNDVDTREVRWRGLRQTVWSETGPVSLGGHPQAGEEVAGRFRKGGWEGDLEKWEGDSTSSSSQGDKKQPCCVAKRSGRLEADERK